MREGMNLSKLQRKFYQRFHVGVDLGQQRDHSALVVVEDMLLNLGTRDAVTFALQCARRREIRKVQRVALGTEYRRVAREVRALLEARELQGKDVSVTVDATGVGNAVVEMLREELRGRRVDLTPVIFTGQGTQRYEGRNCHVPKNELVDRVALALERGELPLPGKLRGVAELVEEMKGMQRARGWRGAPRWETVGKHDDLVMALCLAWWKSDEWPVPLKAPRAFL